MATSNSAGDKARVVVRHLKKSDFREVQRVHRGAYPNLESWDLRQFVS